MDYIRAAYEFKHGIAYESFSKTAWFWTLNLNEFLILFMVQADRSQAVNIKLENADMDIFRWCHGNIE